VDSLMTDWEQSNGGLTAAVKRPDVHAGGHQWSLAHGNEPSTILRVHGDVAVMVSGALGLRPEPSDARAFRKHVVRPLLSITDGSVSIFVCLDSDRRTQADSLHPSRFAREAAGWNETRGVFRDASTNQFDRLQACYERTLPEQFALYVRARPDSLWYAPLVVQTLDAVTLRGRILFVPSDVVHVPEQALSWRCSVYRGPLRCSLVDDQYALVPSRFREAYFLGKCEAPQSRCPAGARTRAAAIELARAEEKRASAKPHANANLTRTGASPLAAPVDPLYFPGMQENVITARLSACRVPVRIASSPQYLRYGVMPVRPRWGNCTPDGRLMGAGNRSVEADELPGLTRLQMQYQPSPGRHETVRTV
jgi:hypothetical protein